MDKREIIKKAKNLKQKYPNMHSIDIAKELRYIVFPLDVARKFIDAHNYRFKNGKKIICINSNYDRRSQNVLCAHELGHAVLDHPYKNEYGGKNPKYEYEATLFAVALLFDEEDFIMPFDKMEYYWLKRVLDDNISR